MKNLIKKPMIFIPMLGALLIIAAIGLYFGGQYIGPGHGTGPEVPVDDSVLTVQYLDVGEGDCILVRNGASTMLIDAGGKKDADGLVKTLTNMGIMRIEMLVATCNDEDHIGGMSAVINSFEIGTMITNGQKVTNASFAEMTRAMERFKLPACVPAAGQLFTLNNAKIQVLGPNRKYSNDQDQSVVLRMMFGDTSFLFLGDAKSAAERDMIANVHLDSDVVKIGAHGSDEASTTAFLKEIGAQYSVISCGKNSLGYPNQTTLDSIKKTGSELYRTDLNGTVTICSNGKTFSVSTERSSDKVFDAAS